MTDKSYVGMGYTVCPVCGTQHDPVVLLNRRLSQTLPAKSNVAWGMCPEHQRLKDEGYVALVECNNRPSGLNDAQRTGNVAHIRSSVWPNLFNVPIPDKGLCFVEVGVIAKLQEKTQP